MEISNAQIDGLDSIVRQRRREMDEVLAGAQGAPERVIRSIARARDLYAAVSDELADMKRLPFARRQAALSAVEPLTSEATAARQVARALWNAWVHPQGDTR